ncbi:hypothetical protein LTR28_003342 [Elasticomyces elasticus]|nr:hypothetical protein LTR28_003342 [Elasticomyces elasticus]
MPAPGDQHRENKASVNPFVDQGVHINEYTAQEIATLSSRLEKQLGPEYISTRPGAGGGKVHYLAAEKVINLANEVFGFNGWSSAIQQVQIDFDIGYGHIENCKGKAAAFEKAKKEAATDALKRALRNFGNVLGNCLYDKDYLQRVTKVKVAPSKWDADNLHRHPDYAPIKRESIAGADVGKENRPPRVHSMPSTLSAGTEYEDEFGGNLFDGVDFTHPDEQVPQTVPSGHEPPPGFLTGRALAADPTIQPPSNPAFNPHAESPSIRRTHGVNPGRSAPIKRTALGNSGSGVPPQTADGPPLRTNFVNPAADMGRRIGMPGGGVSSPLANRGSYKPPTAVKRPAPAPLLTAADSDARPPLADVSNMQQADGAGDAKRQKIEERAGEVLNGFAPKP